MRICGDDGHSDVIGRGATNRSDFSEIPLPTPLWTVHLGKPGSPTSAGHVLPALCALL